MNRQVFIAVVGALTVCLLIGGCGSSGDNGTTTSASTATSASANREANGSGKANGNAAEGSTKAAFLKQGNAICVKTKKQVDAELQAQEKDLISASVYGLQLEVEKIGALEVPSEDAAQIEEMLNTTRKVIVVAPHEEKINQANALLEKAEKIAKEYGLTECLIN